jgi:hypothetical protein
LRASTFSTIAVITLTALEYNHWAGLRVSEGCLDKRIRVKLATLGVSMFISNAGPMPDDDEHYVYAIAL